MSTSQSPQNATLFDFNAEFMTLLREDKDFSVTELVRTDTGFWSMTSHAPSAPLRFLNKRFVPYLRHIQVCEIMHEGDPRTEYKFHFSNEIARSFEIEAVTSDSMSDASSGIHIDLRLSKHQLTDLVVEGKTMAVESALRDMRNLGCTVQRENKRKTAAGVQMRLSVCSKGLERLSQPGPVFCLPTAQYYFGVTFYCVDELQEEIIELLSQSEFRGHVVHESPRWLTIGCSDEISSASLLHTFQQWREAGDISSDIHFRQWKCTASPTAAGCFTCIPKFGIISEQRDSVIAEGIHGRLTAADVHGFLDAVGLPGASFRFYEEEQSRKLLITGLDLSGLKGAKYKLEVTGGITVPLFFSDAQPAQPAPSGPDHSSGPDKNADAPGEDEDGDTILASGEGQLPPFFDDPGVEISDHFDPSQVQISRGADFFAFKLQVGSVLEAKIYDPTGGNEPYECLRITEKGGDHLWKVIPLEVEQAIDREVVRINGPKQGHKSKVFEISHPEASRAKVHKANSTQIPIDGDSESDIAIARDIAQQKADRWATGIKKYLFDDATRWLAYPAARTTVADPATDPPYYDMTTMIEHSNKAVELARRILQSKKIGKGERVARFQDAIRLASKRTHTKHKLSATPDCNTDPKRAKHHPPTGA